MRKIIFSLLACAVIMQACTKEETPGASDKDVDWYAVPDDRTDELGRLRYEVYSQKGVSIFFTDTLGSQVRYNKAGEPYTHYEVLKPGYSIGSTALQAAPVEYEYVEDREDLLEGVKLLRDRLIPRLAPEYLPHCFVLTDNLRSGGYEKAAYRDFTASYIGKTSLIGSMTDKEKDVLVADIKGVLLVSAIVKQFPESMAEFYLITEKSVVQTNFESLYDQRYLSSMFYPWVPATPYALGFLMWTPGFYIRTVTRTIDVEMFIGLVYGYTETEVKEQYGQYKPVMDKYYLMKEVLAEFEKSGK